MKINLITKNIPNCVHLDFQIMDSHVLDDTIKSIQFLTDNNLEIIECDSEDLKLEKYFFGLNTMGYPLNALTDALNTKSDFSSFCKSIFLNDKVTLIFINLHETELENDVDDFLKLLFEWGVSSERIILANNDLYIDRYSKKWNIKVHKTNMITFTYLKGYFEHKIDFKTPKVGKKFLCLNNVMREHRGSLISKLDYCGVLNEVNYSCVGRDFYPLTDKILNVDELEILENNLQKFKVKQIYTKNELDLKKDNSFTFSINTVDYEESYINIVTETYFTEGITHVSEKTLKPFCFYQIPIFLASHNHVRDVRNYYGFDMFDDIVNHSYDSESCDKKRFYKLIDEIKRLSTIDVSKFYLENKKRFESNRDICKKLSENNLDRLFFEKIFI